ncbi:MAG: biotin--[acetyl-CoA-carboxylase] ligase [Pseudomonadota bacterium]
MNQLNPKPSSPIRWPAEAIWEAVAPVLPGFTVEVLPTIDSSNTELMRRFRGSPAIAPQLDATLLVAEQQSAGRGRLGRSWQSQRGDSLTFSLGLPLQPVDWSGLSLVVGISLAESLDPGNNLGLGLKWPNDLWLRDAENTPNSATNSARKGESKLAGILVETASLEGLRHVVIGIGINIRAVALAAAAAAASPSASNLPGVMPPGCLQDLYPDADAASTLLRIVPPLVQAIQAFEKFGFAPFQARFAQRDVLSGRAVRVLEAGNTLEGTAHGVSESGALLVHTATGMKEITSSEVSVRPVADSAAGHLVSYPGSSGPC